MALHRVGVVSFRIYPTWTYNSVVGKVTAKVVIKLPVAPLRSFI